MTNFRRILTTLAVSWFVFCLTVTLVMVVTDHWLVFAAALTPLPSLLVPMSLMGTALFLVIHARAACWTATALLVGLVLTPYGLGPWPRHASSETSDARSQIVILSGNIGQRDSRPLLKFVESVRPDLIASQETHRHFDSAQVAHLEHQKEVGRLALRSRWPILAHDPMHMDGTFFAARFEVGWPVETLVVYIMHLPTPRDAVGDLRGRGILRSNHRKAAAKFQRRKREMLKVLSTRIAAESGPVLLVGDANQPASGPAYRQLTRNLQDGQRAAGWGFGYTIPGTVNTPFLRPFCPWARVDYILAGSQFEFLEHHVEPPHEGQHRALAARLRLRSSHRAVQP